MDKPVGFELIDGYARFAPVQETSLHDAINLVSSAITYAREQAIKKLFVDVTGLTGFSPPTTLERFTLAGEFARAAQSAVKVVLLAKPEMIDPNRFGRTVAANRGLDTNIFSTEAEALAWLLADDAV